MKSARASAKAQMKAEGKVRGRDEDVKITDPQNMDKAFNFKNLMKYNQPTE